VYHLSEKTHQQVTDHQSMDIDPAWSPDGEELAFVSARTGSREIWVLTLAGGRLRQVTDMGKTAGHPVWTGSGHGIHIKGE
jgi:Tol biopolymer transport system component